MEPSTTLPTARRSEDIALDLLKFLASHAHLGRPAASSPGFGAPAAGKSEDQVAQLLELYAKCREAVEQPVATSPSTAAAPRK